MNEQGTIRVLLVDDHVLVREGIAAILNQQTDMCVVAEAVNGLEALKLFLQVKPDVILMDLSMPDGDGVAAVQAICNESPGARIIILTAYDGDENIYQAIKAGARGYLLKTAPRNELLESIRIVRKGRTFFPPEIASRLGARMSGQALTRREQAVLELIVEGLNNQQIAAALFISEGTVKAHINRILSKLHANDRTQATLIAIKRGLVRVY